MFHVHSSGHVTVDDLNGFIDAINPEKILVIHTESNSKENIKLVDRIISVKDGEPIIIMSDGTIGEASPPKIKCDLPLPQCAV